MKQFWISLLNLQLLFGFMNCYSGAKYTLGKEFHLSDSFFGKP